MTFFYPDKSVNGTQGVIGALKGITLGGPTNYITDGGTYGRHMQTGVTQILEGATWALTGAPPAYCKLFCVPDDGPGS